MQTIKTSKARENILSRIRKGIYDQNIPIPFPGLEKEYKHLFAASELSLEEQFATAFSNLGGKFIFCENENEFLEKINILYQNNNWKKLLCSDSNILQIIKNNNVLSVNLADNNPDNENANACITGCELVVARTGSIVFSSHQNFGRTSTIYYPSHLVVVYANQVVPDIDDVIVEMKKKYKESLPSMINFTTGPSRTADIEKTLVVGVHGPEEIYCFFINEERY